MFLLNITTLRVPTSCPNESYLKDSPVRHERSIDIHDRALLEVYIWATRTVLEELCWVTDVKVPPHVLGVRTTWNAFLLLDLMAGSECLSLARGGPSYRTPLQFQRQAISFEKSLSAWWVSRGLAVWYLLCSFLWEKVLYPWKPISARGGCVTCTRGSPRPLWYTGLKSIWMPYHSILRGEF